MMVPEIEGKICKYKKDTFNNIYIHIKYRHEKLKFSYINRSRGAWFIRWVDADKGDCLVRFRVFGDEKLTINLN